MRRRKKKYSLHFENRPITLKRYPDGVEGLFFYRTSGSKGLQLFVRSMRQGFMRKPRLLRTRLLSVWSANILSTFFRAKE